MNGNINMTIELCAEDRARLDRIIKALENTQVGTLLEAQTAEEVKPQATTQPEPEKAVEAKEEPHEVITLEEVTKEPEKAPEVTLEQLQQLVVKLATNGKKAEAREYVLGYASSVTAVPAEQRGELYAKLKKLEG